ncbi:MAG: hypothetical protein KJS68_13510, partial [Alphaproteobacteria bacterium]|nr:hypothetical protein [Alphaproteobacteria bacterium]
RKVIGRLLAEPPHVLATGGGAFMDADTRERMAEHAFSVWLKAPVDVLLARVQRKDDRPLLKAGNPREIIEKLLMVREPIYVLADLTVESENGPHGETVERIVKALAARGICEDA